MNDTRHESYNDDYDDEIYDEDLENEEHAVDETVAGVSAWGVSIVLHAVVLLLMFFIVFYASIKEDSAPITVRVIDPPKEEPPEKERDLVEVVVEIDSEVKVDNPVLHELDMPVEEIETEDEVISDVPIKGREEADAVSEMGGVMAMTAIGAAANAAGRMGFRNGGGRKFAVGRYGGNKASESAVEAALRWFMRHQSANGQWDVDGYPNNCNAGPEKCEPGTFKTNIEGDVACTGYALLCYLGAGYTHRDVNRYQRVVKQGIDWLLATQQANGLLGKRNYEHPVATMALAEAYAMTNDPALREPVQNAINIILERQAKGNATGAQSGDSIGDYGLGWDYVAPKLGRMDSSVSGWNVMALKAAKVGGIDIGNGLDGAKEWLQGAWEAANQQVGIDTQSLDPYGVSQFPYTWDGTSNKVKMHNGKLTCVGGLCAVFLGLDADDPMLSTMANWCYQNQTPTAWPTDTYYMYYNTLTMFQVQGEHWKKWNSQVRDMLVGAQRRGPACFDGSWDPQGAGGHHISEVGRLLVTAYCTLSLEVYYRYLPMAQVKAKAKAAQRN